MPFADDNGKFSVWDGFLFNLTTEGKIPALAIFFTLLTLFLGR